MDLPDRLTEIDDPELRRSLEGWALERVRDESSMFRDALRLFVQMTFVANAAAAVSVTGIIFDGNLKNPVLPFAVICFLIGLLSGLIFGLTLMSSLHQCREKFLVEGSMRYFLGQISHAEFADFHRESTLQRLTMSASGAIALLAFATGIALAVYVVLQNLR